MKNFIKYKILMVGPDLDGLGGISRVIQTWKEIGMFSCYNIKFVPSVSDFKKNEAFFYFINLFKFFFYLCRGCELVYVHTALYKSLYRKLIFLFFSFMMKKRTILHIHPSTVKRYFSRLNRIERVIIFYVFNRVDAIVVLSKETGKYIGQNFPTKKVHILRNPIIVEKMKNKFGIKRKIGEAIYLGWYVWGKGIYKLVDAIEILVEKGTQIHLKCYGTKGINKLKTYVKKKNLEKNIMISGWIGEEDKINALYQSSLLILPSFSEGIPNVILEAMATKTPIVTTPVGGIKEILENENNAIFIKPGDSHDISENILKCLNNDDLRNRIAENAYFEVKSKYDAKIIKKQFSAILYSNFNDLFENQNELMI
jgi:glycosyltransferase involved in cell wall biosynthesis